MCSLFYFERVLMGCDKCVYCGSVEGLEWHHILPRSLGGTDEAFNLIRVCNVHHALLHGMSRRGNISELSKAGIEKAKANGVILGPRLRISPDVLAILCEKRNAGVTLDALSSEYGFDRTTITRVVRKWRNNLEEYSSQWTKRLKQYGQP